METSKNNKEDEIGKIKFPEIEVQLTGTDGNIFALMSKISRTLRENKVSKNIIDEFLKDIMDSSSYDESLSKIMKWVNVY